MWRCVFNKLIVCMCVRVYTLSVSVEREGACERKKKLILCSLSRTGESYTSCVRRSKNWFHLYALCVIHTHSITIFHVLKFENVDRIFVLSKIFFSIELTIKSIIE